MPKLKSATPEASNAPGAFLPDGSWNENAVLQHRGHVHGLVAALVRERRAGKLTPQRAAQSILAANAAAAFPNAGGWGGADTWASVPTSTSAEEAVKREGRGEGGHWCGPQRWLAGSEHDCPEPRHRVKAQPEQAAAALGALVAGVGSASPVGGAPPPAAGAAAGGRP